MEKKEMRLSISNHQKIFLFFFMFLPTFRYIQRNYMMDYTRIKSFVMRYITKQLLQNNKYQFQRNSYLPVKIIPNLLFHFIFSRKNAKYYVASRVGIRYR